MQKLCLYDVIFVLVLVPLTLGSLESIVFDWFSLFLNQFNVIFTHFISRDRYKQYSILGLTQEKYWSFVSNNGELRKERRKFQREEKTEFDGDDNPRFERFSKHLHSAFVFLYFFTIIYLLYSVSFMESNLQNRRQETWVEQYLDVW